MLIDGIALTEGSVISNMTVATGTTLPDVSTLATTGELFYKTGSTPGMYVYDGSAWTAVASSSSPVLDSSTLTGTVVPTATFTGNIIPTTSSTYDIGSAALKWKNIYVDTAHLSVNTLYLGDTPVLGTNAQTIVIKADVDQSMLIQTTGLGTTTMSSATSISVAATGTSGDVFLHADGTGGMVRLSANSDIRLTPGSGGNVVIYGTLKANSIDVSNTNGTSVSFSTSDALIDLNKNISGNGVGGSGLAGIEVWRGDQGASHFQMVFDESVQKFRVGMVGNLQTLATQPYVDAAITAATPTFSSLTGKPTTLSGYGITDAYSSSNPAAYISGNQTVTLSGDVTGTGATSITATLATVNSNVGSYGDTTNVGAFTVNAKGLVTAASSSAIAFPVTTVFGRTGAVTLTSSDVTTALTYTPLSDAGDTFNGNLTSNGTSKITGLPTPTVDSDAVNKAYVDAAVTGLTWKNTAAVATTANITLSGTQTIDGYAVQVGDRVLVKNQTTAAQNGLYVAASGAWTRSTDADTGLELDHATVFVEHGTAQADTGWTVSNSTTPVLGTDPVTWVQFNGASNITAGVGLTKSGNTISVALGAGIVQLPTSEVGIDLYTGGGLMLTLDGTASSTDSASQLSLGKVGTAGTYNTVTTDAFGRVTAGSNAAYLTGNQSITASGDATGTGTTSLALTLATVNSNVGSFGSTTQVPVVTVNAKGLVTAVSNSSIAFPVTSINDITGAITAAQISAAATTGYGFTPLSTVSWATPGTIGNTTPNTGAFTSLSASGVFTSSVATGTSPLVVSSTTLVSNLNADLHDGMQTATANTASTVVARDASGNFSAGTITATLSGTATNASYVNGTQQTSVFNAAPVACSMAASDSTYRGSIVIKSAATTAGDSNLAGITFWHDAYALKMGVRNDGVFGIGSWSRAAWSWYSDASGNMVAAGNVTAYSDPRLKENFTNITGALDKVQSLNGGSFTWKHGIPHTEVKAGKKDFGILANEVEAIMPEIVTDSINIDGEKYKTVSYEKLVPLLIEAIKELSAEVKALKAKIGE